eukprot:766890-Hanusia_phi.AAC.1
MHSTDFFLTLYPASHNPLPPLITALYPYFKNPTPMFPSSPITTPPGLGNDRLSFRSYYPLPYRPVTHSQGPSVLAQGARGSRSEYHPWYCHLRDSARGARSGDPLMN